MEKYVKVKIFTFWVFLGRLDSMRFRESYEVLLLHLAFQLGVAAHLVR